MPGWCAGAFPAWLLCRCTLCLADVQVHSLPGCCAAALSAWLVCRCIPCLAGVQVHSCLDGVHALPAWRVLNDLLGLLFGHSASMPMYQSYLGSVA